MNNYKNCRTTVHIREIIVKRMIHENVCPADVARAFGIRVRTVHKWLRRRRDEGSACLENRSSVAHTLRHRLSAAYEELIVYLRRSFRMSARYIARKPQLARSTVAALLKRHCMGKLKQLDPKEPVRRFERAAPGELLHLDIKKLDKLDQPDHRITGNRRVNGRGARWEFVHVCVDDYSQLAYVEVLQDEKGETAAASWSGPPSTSRNWASPSTRSLPTTGHATDRKSSGRPASDSIFTIFSPDPTGRSERQGRAFHTNADIRMGLRERVSNIRRAQGPSATVAFVLQPGARTL